MAYRQLLEVEDIIELTLGVSSSGSGGGGGVSTGFGNGDGEFNCVINVSSSLLVSSFSSATVR